MQPIKVKVRNKEFLDITWDSNESGSIKLSNLRNHCPCAICNAEKNDWSPTYIPLYTKEQLNIVELKTVGTYALSIKWEDGHNTGIYDYEYLYKLFKQFPAKQ